MSAENVELVRRMYGAYVSGDTTKALDFCHPQVRADFSVRVDTGGIGTGRDELNSIVASWVSAWEDYSEEIEEVRDLGDRVCVTAIQRGRGKESGLEMENRFASVYEVRDGLIVSITMFSNPEEAMRA